MFGPETRTGQEKEAGAMTDAGTRITRDGGMNWVLNVDFWMKRGLD